MDIEIVFSFILVILIFIIIINYVTITISDYGQKDIINKCGLQNNLFNKFEINESIPTNNILKIEPKKISTVDDYHRQFYLNY